MYRKQLWVWILCCISATATYAQKKFEIISPDGRLKVQWTVGKTVAYTIFSERETIVRETPVSVVLESGEVWGENAVVKKVHNKKVSTEIEMPFGTSKTLKSAYNEMVFEMKGGWGIACRVYDEGVAYRLLNHRTSPFNIKEERLVLNLPADFNTHTNYVVNRSNGKPETKEQQLNKAFENEYTETPVSGLNPERLIQLPLLLETSGGSKLCFTEVNLEAYPGLYLHKSSEPHALNGFFAAYPKTFLQGGFRNTQMNVTSREPYIAKVTGKRAFPWRVFIIAREDKDLLSSELVYKLGDVSRINDISWIQPGMVAWEWWHDSQLAGVNFRAGMNIETYKYYIDFAAKNKLGYIVIDEGWSDRVNANLMQVNPDMDIREIVNYGKTKQVGVILWAGYRAFERDLENVCRHYAAMGVKGFKVDFLNRDDQQMVEFVYKAAEVAAKYKLILNLHGMYKPTGTQRTWPNILNYEGVLGMENVKWNETADYVKNDLMIPFIRMAAGPMDYTPGAMRNASRESFKSINSMPMSLGTRCRQLAMYIVYKGPLQMLSDSPHAYEKEKECLDFIRNTPVVWDSTLALDGKLGEYAVVARKKNEDWWIGGLNDWTERMMTVDFSFLPAGNFEMELFEDGVNANRWAVDYKGKVQQVSSGDKIEIKLAPGGGFALRLKRK